MMKRYGLIGRSLSHSASKTYFSQLFQRERITDCRYDLYELRSIEGLDQLLEAHPDLRGLNVTIPYKKEVIPMLDSLSYEAQCVGAVNCIRLNEDGTKQGFNTDVVGLRLSLTALLGEDLPEAALILGTGGASQAVQYVLTEFGIPFELVSRDPMRANYTYDFLPTDLVAQSRLIVQATPVGTYPDVEEAPRLPYAYLTPDHYLLDLVYNPECTSFLDYGMQRGAHVMNGRMMLEAQAEASWTIWNERN